MALTIHKRQCVFWPPYIDNWVCYKFSKGQIIRKMRLKSGSKNKYKAWIAVFVCFSFKACHLEAVSDLTAEAFVAAPTVSTPAVGNRQSTSRTMEQILRHPTRNSGFCGTRTELKSSSMMPWTKNASNRGTYQPDVRTSAASGKLRSNPQSTNSDG